MEDSEVREKLDKLSIREKAFLIAYVQSASFDKVEAWCLARYNRTYGEILDFMLSEGRTVPQQNVVLVKIRSMAAYTWTKIEKAFGGLRPLMDFIGLDDTRLMLEHRRLLQAQKPMVNSKTGEIIWYDDAMAQVRNLQLLHEVRGNIVEKKRHEFVPGGGEPLRIDFGDKKLELENMTISGELEVAQIDAILAQAKEPSLRSSEFQDSIEGMEDAAE